MYRKLSAAEVVGLLTVPEFSRLCTLVDIGFGKKIEPSNQLGHRTGMAVGPHSGFVQFDIYEVRRKGNGDPVVAIDIGKGCVGTIDIVKMEHTVQQAAFRNMNDETVSA